ncbi:MAG: type II CRISPR RNA-guided endonuclease Cas9 [Clostridia bacterium]|nr:type II CRISPR RNA-guided endonuclease Cas9 [Clostridia bacterium]
MFGENFALLEAARAIYNFFVFEKMLDGNNCISQAMVAIYEKHKADLELLKSFVKGTLPQKAYYRLFRSTKEAANYAAYVGYTKIKAKKVPVKKCKIEEFYKFVKKILMESVEVGAETGTLPGLIFAEMENGTFLPKILHADNGLFPHQVNGAELDAILENLCKDYPEFARKDEDGFTPAEKIKKIFLFKIPYYVGPLNNYHEEVGNSWVVRKKGRITPWNFDEMVNKAASNEKFIRRMTNKCSYLYGKDVLPKCSIVYQAFDVLNQLNKIKINEQPISVELKQKLFHDLFLTRKKVTKKAMRDYLVANGYVSQGEAKELSFSGFDGELQANMNSYITLKSKLGDFVDSHLEVCEEIILWHTLNTDKAVVESQILEKYGNEPIVKEKIKELKGLTSFKDFGRLSRELLCELSGGVEPTTGENYTILGLLYRTNANFNEILNDKRYTFLQAIEEENSGSKDEIGYEDLEELYVSPMVRRGIWQALQMTEEYVRAVGKAPDKIFLEVTREHEAEKQRTQSRKNQLLALYENCKDCKDISALLEQLNSKTDSELRQERLYLYFKQLGRCAYTGKSIDLEELSTDLYDVDHIMPRSITKDDGLENKVLVLRAKNAEKSDTYPLPSGFTDQQSFWKILKAKGLMGEKKYALLTRTAPLTEEDFRSFISRQLVVTNQTVKAVAELLKRKYGAQGTRIVYSKAANVSDFRQRFNLVKCRETNDLHHARDAYLNIVVGNVYDTKFTCAGDYFYRKDDAWREYSLKTLFFRDVEGAWKKVESICIVKRILAKPSMIVTRYAFVNKGGFYDETVYGKGDNGVSVPRKGVGPYTQTEKYGGFKSLSTAYFTIVASKDKKGNLIKTIEAVPVLVDYQCKGNVERLLEYFSSNGLIEPKILVAKLKVKSLISVNGFKGWIAGITGKQILLHKAQQWFTDEKTDLYVKNLVKLADWDRTGKLDENERLAEGFPMVTNRNGEVKLAVDRVQNLCLYDEILENLNKPIYRGVSGSASFAQKIAGKKEQFGSLSVLEQAKVLLQIIRFMKCNAECADLTLLNDVATCGKLLINKNITGVDFKIIHQSPCGLISRIDNV